VHELAGEVSGTSEEMDEKTPAGTDERQSHEEGREEELRESIHTFCQVSEIELGADREAILAGMGTVRRGEARARGDPAVAGHPQQEGAAGDRGLEPVLHGSSASDDGVSQETTASLRVFGAARETMASRPVFQRLSENDGTFPGLPVSCGKRRRLPGNDGLSPGLRRRSGNDGVSPGLPASLGK
jgi:hypothetical protein